MPEILIRDVPVNFPFKPYDVQKAYMEKVIECLQNKQNGVLESPTGTGKTLSLLCSSLAWLSVKKAQIQLKAQGGQFELPNGDFVTGLVDNLNASAGITPSVPSSVWGVPKIIYASRTHSQLSQAMQELKRTAYSHVRVSVLGSRDQLCVHPEVTREPNNSIKVHMCRVRVSSRTCFFYNNVELKKDDPAFKSEGILDIEDLVVAGRKARCCPYYLARELKQTADIIFLPYNYLLDPSTRETLGLEIANNVIILDEAHNIEKMCEESASLQIRSSDIALCIEEITQVMEDIFSEANSGFIQAGGESAMKDFTTDDLCVLKTMFLEFEKAVDAIEVAPDGSTFPGSFLFDLLSKVEITFGKKNLVLDLLGKIIQYLSTTSTSPFQRKGIGLQKFVEMLKTVFSNNNFTAQHVERVKKCYKVHVTFEEVKSSKGRADSWSSSKTPSLTSPRGRQINYWCFSPGFGMQTLVEQGAHCVILTSGTLAPLKPLVSELSIPVPVQLENPHVISPDQVFVGILHAGPDGHTLNSSYNTRNDPRYITSLGRTILNLSRITPGGLLIFFPSYPMLRKCQEEWQLSGIWTQICTSKPILVEPQSKEAFLAVMSEYYSKIQDPAVGGACFLAVTRGKVSEGLDFADMNGRAVVITGLPYPPFKDPRIVLKQKYLDENRTKENEMLSGRDWYQLEASRAVNQAMGRVIRHAKDYGVVLLCDCRFDNAGFKRQLSSWLQPYIKSYPQFGPVLKTIRSFFRQADLAFPCSTRVRLPDSSLAAVPASFDTGTVRQRDVGTGKLSASENTLTESSTWSVQQYITAAASSTEKLGAGMVHGSSVLEALESHTTTVSMQKDLTDVNVENLSGTSSIPSAQPPPVKKRKMKMTPFIYNLSDSSQSSSVVPLSDNGQISATGLALPSDPLHKKPPVERQACIKGYVLKVKNALDRGRYQKFISAVKEYKAENNIENLMQQMQEIFLHSTTLYPYFLGFRAFLKQEHEAEFDKLCEQKNIRCVAGL